MVFSFSFLFLKDLFLNRGEEREREGNINVWLPLMQTTGDLARNPDMCPDLGIEPVTLWFTGQHSIHWVTPAKANGVFFPCT